MCTTSGFGGGGGCGSAYVYEYPPPPAVGGGGGPGGYGADVCAPAYGGGDAWLFAPADEWLSIANKYFKVLYHSTVSIISLYFITQ